MESKDASRVFGAVEASFKIGIIMFFHLSELEMMTRRLSILWEQKSVRNTSVGFFFFLLLLLFFFVRREQRGRLERILHDNVFP